jgi:hypothetical protein
MHKIINYFLTKNKYNLLLIFIQWVKSYHIGIIFITKYIAVGLIDSIVGLLILFFYIDWVINIVKCCVKKNNIVKYT